MIACERDRIALSWSLRAGIVFFGLLCTALPGKAQAREPFRADRMDTVLYGVAYYPEYMPYDRLEQDVQPMQKAGITIFRLPQPPAEFPDTDDGYTGFLHELHILLEPVVGHILRVIRYAVQHGIHAISPERFAGLGFPR